MGQTVLEKQRTIKGKTTSTVLSIVALIFMVLSYIEYFLYYSVDWEISFPSESVLLYILLKIIPYILFMLYITKFYKKYEATILVPITFGLIAIICCVYHYESIGSKLIWDIAIIITFGLATFSALKGLQKKALLISALVVGLLVTVISILYTILDSVDQMERIIKCFEDGLYPHIFRWPFCSIYHDVGTILFYVALFSFALKNNIPVIVSTSFTKKKKNNPERDLRVLKEKLEFGAITEEEYQAQRAEIISNL